MRFRVFAPCVALAAFAAGCSSGGTLVGSPSTKASGTSASGSVAPTSSSSAGGSTTAVQSGGSTTGRVTSPDGDFSVQVPAGWHEDRSTASKYHVAEFYVGPVAGGFTTNVNVEVEDAGSLSLEQYVQQALTRLKGQLAITDQTKPDSTTLDGSAALGFAFSDTQGGVALQQAQLVSLHSGKAYVITYTAREGDAFTSSASAVRSIQESWHWS